MISTLLAVGLIGQSHLPEWGRTLTSWILQQTPLASTSSHLQIDSFPDCLYVASFAAQINIHLHNVKYCVYSVIQVGYALDKSASNGLEEPVHSSHSELLNAMEAGSQDTVIKTSPATTTQISDPVPTAKTATPLNITSLDDMYTMSNIANDSQCRQSSLTWRQKHS